jgi:hypothetical protein
MPLIAVAMVASSCRTRRPCRPHAPQRTEAEARARADENRRKRADERRKTNAPVELMPDYMSAVAALNALIRRVFATHRNEMDVFHAKRIRAVTCGGAERTK